MERRPAEVWARIGLSDDAPLWCHAPSVCQILTAAQCHIRKQVLGSSECARNPRLLWHQSLIARPNSHQGQRGHSARASHVCGGTCDEHS